MLSHYHGQILNYRELSRSFGLSDTAVRHYLEILEGTFMIRILKQWYENIGKRLVKAPKLYLRDSGIFHALQGITDIASLTANPKLGSSWEGFVLEELIGISGHRPESFSFYQTQAGAETDLVWSSGASRIGVEIEYADAPRVTPSMRHAMEDCKLDSLFVVYPGSDEYALAENIRVVPALSMGAIIPRLPGLSCGKGTIAEDFDALFPEPQHRRLRDLAQREDRPVSELVRSAVDLWLSRHEADVPEVHDDPPIFR